LARSKKKAVTEDWELVFVDESGFYLLPGVVRTWAPRGETPILRHRLTRDHVSVISGITPSGELYTTMQDHAFTSPDCVRFLKHLRRQIGRKIIVVWDGAPIHRSKVVKEYLATDGKGEVHLERFPSYAPELNPDEGIWRQLKYVELRNLCCETLDELKLEIRKAIVRIRRRSSIVLACIQQPGLMMNQ
jgi:transposase